MVKTRLEENERNNGQLLQNYIPKIVPFMVEGMRNKNSNSNLPNKTSDNTTYETNKRQTDGGKYYYKVF